MSYKSDKEMFAAMVAKIQEFAPRFKVGPKKARWHHRFINRFMSAIGMMKKNQYLNDYWTSFASTAEWDNDDRPGEHYTQDWDVLPHEGKHALQVRRNSMFLFGPLYICGTFLYTLFGILLSLPLFITGAFVEALPWWSGFFPLGLGLLLSSPWPFGHWRGRWEMQAYKLSIAITYWRQGRVAPHQMQHWLKQFKGSEYSWMGLAIRKPEKQFAATLKLLEAGKYIGADKHFEKFERAIYGVMKDGGHIHKNATPA